MPKTAIVMAPMIFGSSRSFERDADRLRALGYTVKTFDFFAAADLKRPLPLPWRVNAIARDLNRHKRAILRELAGVVRGLKETHEQVVLVGRSYGANVFLWFAETDELPVIALYPLLAFPRAADNTDPPNLNSVTAHATVIYGTKDDKVGISMEIARDCQNPLVMARFVGGAGHGFADAQMYKGIPSPLYRRKPAKKAWEMMLDALNALKVA